MMGWVKLLRNRDAVNLDGNLTKVLNHRLKLLVRVCDSVVICEIVSYEIIRG